MEGWERVKVVTGAIATVLIPAVVLVAGNQYSRALKEREIQGKYVELAINILRAPPTEVSQDIRTWATEVVNLYSGVPLSQRTREDLIRTGALTDIAGSPSANPGEQSPAVIAGDATGPRTSQRQEGVVVPNILGLRQDEAAKLLARAGLTTGKVDRGAVGQLAAGMIVSQSPAAGTRASRGTPVAILITEATQR